MKYLSVQQDAKTSKGVKKGFLTGILYLAPASESGKTNTCPYASAGCKATCLFSAGRGRFTNVRNARIRRTLEFLENRQAFFNALTEDIRELIRKAEKHGMIPCVRLNGTSDMPILPMTLTKQFPNVQFYDYTKNPSYYRQFLDGKLPENLYLTFSRSETNEKNCLEFLARGGTVAVVFDKLPTTWHGFTVIDGDETDLRFLDPRGVVVGLKAKGNAKKNSGNGFVVKE